MRTIKRPPKDWTTVYWVCMHCHAIVGFEPRDVAFVELHYEEASISRWLSERVEKVIAHCTECNQRGPFLPADEFDNASPQVP